MGHTDDVKSLAVHPDKITIASGQVAGKIVVVVVVFVVVVFVVVFVFAVVLAVVAVNVVFIVVVVVVTNFFTIFPHASDTLNLIFCNQVQSGAIKCFSIISNFNL